MSASPEPQARSPAASPDRDVPEKVATPIVGDDDSEKPTDPVADEGPAEGAEAEPEEQPEDDDDDAKLSDDESILSEVDEAQFENFDPENVDVEDRPQLAIDEENLKLIGRHKRKRTEDGEEGRSRRKKEGRREKKGRGARDEEEGEEGSSRRKDRKKRAEEPDTDEETMDPETRMCCDHQDCWARTDEMDKQVAAGLWIVLWTRR